MSKSCDQRSETNYRPLSDVMSFGRLQHESQPVWNKILLRCRPLEWFGPVSESVDNIEKVVVTM